MAGMQIRPIADFSPVPATTQVQIVRSPLADTEKPETKKQEKEEELQNVVSKSEDGDTVQVGEKSSEKLEDLKFGRMDVLPKDEEKKDEEKTGALPGSDRRSEEQKAAAIKEREKEEREKTEEKKQAEENKQLEENKQIENNKQTVTSFSGLTEDQIEAMYRKGEISKQEYDKQIELKESLKETEEQTEGDTTKMVKGLLSSEDKAERDSLELKTVFSEDSSDKTEAAARISIMDTLEKNLLGLP